MSPVALFLLLVLAVCSWPALRLLANPSFRQVAPRQWWALAIAGLFALAAAVSLAVFQPGWLYVALDKANGSVRWRASGNRVSRPRSSVTP